MVVVQSVKIPTAWMKYLENLVKTHNSVRYGPSALYNIAIRNHAANIK